MRNQDFHGGPRLTHPILSCCAAQKRRCMYPQVCVPNYTQIPKTKLTAFLGVQVVGGPPWLPEYSVISAPPLIIVSLEANQPKERVRWNPRIGRNLSRRFCAELRLVPRNVATMRGDTNIIIQNYTVYVARRT